MAAFSSIIDLCPMTCWQSMDKAQAQALEGEGEGEGEEGERHDTGLISA